LVVVVAAGEFGAEVEEAPRAREIEIRDPDGSRIRDAHGSWTGATRNFLAWLLTMRNFATGFMSAAKFLLSPSSPVQAAFLSAG
jgi:hypothetical protein